MKELKLTEILSSFTQDEMKRFKKFVESPYHNGSENVTHFSREVIKFYPDFLSKNFNLNYIHLKLFPNKKYHEGVMRNLVSDLYKLAEKFLVVDKILNHGTEYELNLLKELKQRDLTSLFNANYKKCRSKLDITKKDDNYLYYLYQFERELCSLVIVEKKTGKKHEEFVLKTVEVANHLVKFFLVRILTSYCSIVSNVVDFKIKPILIFYKEIKQHLENHKYEDTPVIMLYFESLKLSLGDGDEKTFYRLHSGINKHKNSLQHDDLHVLYINLLNYAIIKRDYESCYEIINEILDGEYFTRKGTIMNMEYGFYSAAVHMGLILKKNNWVENFLKNFKIKLHPPQRESAYHYHSALLEFVKKNFEKSLALLNNLNPSDFFLLVYTQRLKLALYYELDRREEIDYLMDSYKHTLSRHKQIGDRYKKSGKDFLENFTGLVRLKDNFESYRYSVLKRKVQTINEKSIFKEWFIEKLDYLQDSN